MAVTTREYMRALLAGDPSKPGEFSDPAQTLRVAGMAKELGRTPEQIKQDAADFHAGLAAHRAEEAAAGPAFGTAENPWYNRAFTPEQKVQIAEKMRGSDQFLTPGQKAFADGLIGQ